MSVDGFDILCLPICGSAHDALCFEHSFFFRLEFVFVRDAVHELDDIAPHASSRMVLDETVETFVCDDAATWRHFDYVVATHSITEGVKYMPFAADLRAFSIAIVASLSDIL